MLLELDRLKRSLKFSLAMMRHVVGSRVHRSGRS